MLADTSARGLAGCLPGRGEGEEEGRGDSGLLLLAPAAAAGAAWATEADSLVVSTCSRVATLLLPLFL